MFGSGRVSRIAHLSDVHTLERERDAYGWGVKFVSIQRPLDAEARLRKFGRALALAKASGADHVVVSGDLTEMGTDAQFRAFADVLDASGIAPLSVTLVPGNHDAYTTGDAWTRALAGPLRAYASSSSARHGQVVERGGVVLLPVDTSRYQNVALSGGELHPDAAAALTRRIHDAAFRYTPIVVVTHHPPFSHARRLWQYIDGLRGATRLVDVLAKSPHVQVLHGHMHRALDRLIGGLGRSRVFGAPATVEDSEGRPRIRLYEVGPSGLESAGIVTG
jgi:3',5'-cyclic-AMP phosphodiesterase